MRRATCLIVLVVTKLASGCVARSRGQLVGDDGLLQALASYAHVHGQVPDECPDGGSSERMELARVVFDLHARTGLVQYARLCYSPSLQTGAWITASARYRRGFRVRTTGTHMYEARGTGPMYLLGPHPAGDKDAWAVRLPGRPESVLDWERHYAGPISQADWCYVRSLAYAAAHAGTETEPGSELPMYASRPWMEFAAVNVQLPDLSYRATGGNGRGRAMSFLDTVLLDIWMFPKSGPLPEYRWWYAFLRSRAGAAEVPGWDSGCF